MFFVLYSAFHIPHSAFLHAASYAPGKIIVKFKSQRSLRVLGQNSLAVQSISGVDTVLAKAGFKGSRYLMPVMAKLQRTNGGLVTQALQERFPLRSKRGNSNISLPDLNTIVVMDVDPATDLEVLVNELKKNSEIEYAERVPKIYPQYLPNDPYMASSGTWGQSYRDQWGPILLQTPEAYELSSPYEHNATIIAIIDTGVDYNHSEISQNIWTGVGYDFGDSDTDPIPVSSGHGTHVAGIAAARGNNDAYICGVSPTSQVMILKVFGDDGSGDTGAIVQAIDYAVSNSADVMNLSLASDGTSSALETSVAAAAAAGVVIVAASGNGASGNIADNLDLTGGSLFSEVANDLYPVESDGTSDQVIGVGAIDHNQNITYYSNYGGAVDLCAPGTDILSLRSSVTNDEPSVESVLLRDSGTSMAAPHVAGVAALMLQVNPDLTYSALKQRIYASATDLGTAGKDVYFGYGLVNAFMAVALSDPVPPTFGEHIVPSVQESNTPMTVTFSILDNFDMGALESLLPSASVYYEFLVDNTTPIAAFTEIKADLMGSSDMTATIPTPDLIASDIAYYIVAHDFNPSNDVTTPSNAPTSFFDVLLRDVSGPSVNYQLSNNDNVSLFSAQSIYLKDNVQTLTSSIQVGITDTFGALITFDSTSSLVTYSADTLSFNWPSSNYYNLPGIYGINVYAQDVTGNENALSINVTMTTLSDLTSSFKILGPTGGSSSPLTYPNPFDPATQHATFAYQLPQAANVGISIYSLARNVVWSTSVGQALGYHNEITWDGTDTSGRALPNGVYPFVITATSTSSGEVARARGKIVLLR